MLVIEGLKSYYGKIMALKGISFNVKEGEIISIIGSNGAGKTTTLRVISGLLRDIEGNISFMGKSIVKFKPYEIAKLGIIHVPEGRGVFPNLTVYENLEIGGYTIKDKKRVKSNIEKVYEIFPRLLERRYQKAGTLSGGEQQMLAIGRGLIAEPKILLLDEPSLGLAPIVVKEIFKVIKKINREDKVTILLVEQNAKISMEISERTYVLETGLVVKEGISSQLINDDFVKKAYLGL
ncbi:MAG TPA: ABC transporter ATP-binding protein [Spirochaetota bacterium]|nr:ABC transporter ATP-binding protein [Spirochaetota bacterium]HOM39156.1 ABC transporter ATP-binding protein [Spirochaetota bacterium]HPQ48333.1 ABC transporter ATP-binding protein [Spirochaetota bacterium]